MKCIILLTIKNVPVHHSNHLEYLIESGSCLSIQSKHHHKWVATSAKKKKKTLGKCKYQQHHPSDKSLES